MSPSIREYLMDRFRSDGETLRARAATLDKATLDSATERVAGPDAATSRQMADACDDVVALAATLPEASSVARMLEALQSLLPVLANRSGSAESARTPAVRSVYAGAATRVQELIAIETRTGTPGSRNTGANDSMDTDE